MFGITEYANKKTSKGLKQQLPWFYTNPRELLEKAGVQF